MEKIATPKITKMNYKPTEKVKKKTLSDFSKNNAQNFDNFQFAFFDIKRNLIHNRILNRYPYEIIKLPIDAEAVKKLQIRNIKPININSLRGETLSSPKNRWAIGQIKSLGIESIIDLREKYSSKNYDTLCRNAGLKYYHFPIDSASVPDRIIIQNFPLMFKVLNQGRYYIACAQGLHRTDIALALNYIFNPSATEIPVMSGHYQCDMNCADITRRINSVAKNISDEELKNLGWGENARDEIQQRKKDFIKFFNDNKPKK